MFFQPFTESNKGVDVITSYIMKLKILEEQVKLLELLEKINEGGENI